MTQRQINAAHRRSLKKTYKGLTPPEKVIVKCHEKIYWLDISINNTYRLGKVSYGDDFRKHPGFQDDFERIFDWVCEKEKLFTKIGRLEDKHGLEYDKVIEKFRTLNRNRGYGGSF